MTYIADGSKQRQGARIVDLRHHFLGLLTKGGELRVYCHQCKAFFSVMLQMFHREPASSAPKRDSD